MFNNISNNSTLGMSSYSSSLNIGQTTERGTKIINPGDDMNKDTFLKILSAQMSNQDPTKPQDGAEYISQFAQFAAMEQMANLNNTMSLHASQALIDKNVLLRSCDNSGNPIEGIVKSVSHVGSNISLCLEYLNEQGETTLGEFKRDEVVSVKGVNDLKKTYKDGNINLLIASSMLNKYVEFKDEDVIRKGLVNSLVVEDDSVKLNVKTDNKSKKDVITLDEVIRVIVN